MKLRYRLCVFENVFQNVGAVDHIEGPCRIMDVGYVHLYHGGRILKVGGKVIDVFSTPKEAGQLLFGRDVEHPLVVAIKQIGPCLNI